MARQHQMVPVGGRRMDVDGSVANLTKGRGAPGRKTCSTYVSALARRSCSNVMASVRTHGPTPKARSTILASREALYALLGADLTQIHRLGPHVAVKLISECGTDMTKWPSAKHFTSWLWG